MNIQEEKLAPYLAESSKIGEEISITGKWVPTKKGGMFRKSAESKEMLKEWEDIHHSQTEPPISNKLKAMQVKMKTWYYWNFQESLWNFR